jgi:biotin-(acetyl-CoA carboxylase) ligase
MWEGSQVWISEGDKQRSAVTCGLSDIGGLMVRTPDGKVETILAADVRVDRITKAPIGIDVDSNGE